MNQQHKQNKIVPLRPQLAQRGLPPDAPHSDLLERSVIAAMFRYHDFANRVIAEVSTRRVFFSLRHQIIFDAIASVSKTGVKPDTVTVSEHLLSNGQLKDIGGPAYFTELLAEYRREQVGSPDLDSYIDGLKGYYARWQMLEAADAIRKQAFDMQHPPDQSLYKAQEKLSQVGEFVLSDVFAPMSVATQLHADHTEAASDTVVSLPTGITNMDGLIDGLQKQKIVVVAGRPHHAKTSVSMSIAYNVARAGGRVLIFNVADGNKHDVLSRIIAMESGLPYSAVMSGNIPIKDYGRYIESLRKVNKMHLYIQSKKGMTMPQLQAEARALSGVNGLDLIFIDYIQRLRVDTSHPKAPHDQYGQQAHISQSITEIAEQLNVPIMVAAQINRAGNGKLPEVSHIKGCGNIEEDADMVWLVYRDWLDDHSHPFPQQIQIKVGKNKVNGRLGTVLCDIDAMTTYVKSK